MKSQQKKIERLNRLKSLKGERFDSGANDGSDNKCQELDISHDSSENSDKESFFDTDSSSEMIQVKKDKCLY